MGYVLNILISLGIISFIKYGTAVKQQNNLIYQSTPMTSPIIKRPVYKPLRPRPYTKYTMKA